MKLWKFYERLLVVQGVQAWLVYGLQTLKLNSFSTSALLTSCWIIRHLLSDQFYGPDGRIALLHARFEEHFKRLEKQSPGLVRGPFGIGAMVIFTPFDGEAQRVAKLVQDLFHAGVISFVAGSRPTRVRFLIPAGVMSMEDVDAVMEIVEKVLKEEK